MRQADLITNFEARRCLQTKAKLGDVIGDHSAEIKWLRDKVGKYLDDTVVPKQDAGGIKSFIQAIHSQFDGPSKLTKAEILQLINMAPRTDAEVHLIVEECGERFGDEEVLEIVRLVSTHLRSETEERNEEGEQAE